MKRALSGRFVCVSVYGSNVVSDNRSSGLLRDFSRIQIFVQSTRNQRHRRLVFKRTVIDGIDDFCDGNTVPVGDAGLNCHRCAWHYLASEPFSVDGRGIVEG